ncbi:SDR family oxidoreductase [Piscinibacter koreensis]|uniref:SDR family oxidoreductase n=1 Tax=Piscinibacter koreensis TaxID=2742824 RepID=A0A7Y6NMR1_9BURK|nr:SDR family oxidoreductase [Schlegelella koreensis]NUZ06015.1 SDR family oxidoreductase [Schlegelella koreensis]
MNVLLVGASGFIGSRLRAALAESGHQLRLAGRSAPGDLQPDERWVRIDLTEAVEPAAWSQAVQGVDVAVNCVGILREHGSQTFDVLHTRAPAALFRACAAAGVRRVVQVSALGADDAATSAYHHSKRAADEVLLGLPIEAAVAQPSLVFGSGGASARLFTALATAPVLPLPAGGKQPLQPIHVDDLIPALQALVERPLHARGRIPLVGPRATTLAGYVAALRRSLGLPPALTFAVPAALVGLGARVLQHVPASPLDPETWAMLQRGNVAPADATTALLGRSPRDVAAFVPRAFAFDVLRSAALAWLVPLLRLALVAVWIVTGIVSLGIYPVDESYALLARAGVPPALAPLALYGAAGLDLAFGVATLLLKGRRWLWLAQLALIAGYTAIITVRLPEFWLHPYGPVLKNLPIVAILVLLLVLDRGGDSRR